MRPSPETRRRPAAALAAALTTALLTGVLSVPAHAAPASHTIVVAATGAANADDDGNGRRDEPLATLAEAQRRVRAALAQGEVNVTVELLDGVHRLTAPLRLDAADSGARAPPSPGRPPATPTR
ncbi:hypothetical protein [Herbidospora sp. NBRC 101105]|uniref:hypothetical protein n=1 Tax=Herbidospora sp. NBRC 101105 TaxID=3032195 RepID=UPI0024A16240|nr:hypothetical protein [Herbidospora sp. NBRC 101105]GLX97253.1 hypothetical protein Hesp01_52030 [Herbidospora sp. NBRC 101105]